MSRWHWNPMACIMHQHASVKTTLAFLAPPPTILSPIVLDHCFYPINELNNYKKPEENVLGCDKVVHQ